MESPDSAFDSYYIQSPDSLHPDSNSVPVPSNILQSPLVSRTEEGEGTAPPRHCHVQEQFHTFLLIHFHEPSEIKVFRHYPPYDVPTPPFHHIPLPAPQTPCSAKFLPLPPSPIHDSWHRPVHPQGPSHTKSPSLHTDAW